MSVQPVLQLDRVSKSFGPVKVIDSVSIDVHAGHVQALLGENGAGKSTLIKMMAGVYQPDSGRILVDGTPTTLPNVKAAEAHGIATIHQELNLVPTMTVAENLMLGRTPSRWGLVDYKALRKKALKALRMIGVDVSLDTPVGELGIARQQLVEIAKALSMNARVFISHHLDEIARIADSVSVLRDGGFVAEVPASTPEKKLVTLMVGRDIDDQFPRVVPPKRGKPLLEVRNLTSAGNFQDVSLTVRAGEVVGLAGLVGAGRTELVRAIAGADRVDSGEVRVRGKRLPNGDISAAIRHGVGHVPEDRKAQGLILDAPVLENLGLATLRSTSRYGLADLAGQRTRSTAVSEKLRIRMASIDQPIRDLSGGNQQKAVFGRWVLAGSKVLLLDEPTRGVDVGAKVEIYNIINEVTAQGGAVLMVSSELPEILGMSDRVVVMSGGRIAGEMDAADATQDSIMQLAVAQVEDHLTAAATAHAKKAARTEKTAHSGAKRR